MQTSQALRSGMNYEGKSMRFELADGWGFPIPKENLYVPHYCKNCKECSMKLVCNGCSDCGKCTKTKKVDLQSHRLHKAKDISWFC